MEGVLSKKDYTEYLSVMTDDFADQDGNQYEYRNQLWGYYTWQREQIFGVVFFVLDNLSE